jgi:hypothetical protein
MLGTLISWIVFNQLSPTQINKIAIFITCYLFGTVIEAIRIACIKVMKIMKANE